ncbi:MAG: hypothetical protein JSV65_11015 [Armatimonadota bacterium]|nr:MAG: hypothetical protein JSV65_11015 [Armatimonadota bacterium]
MRCALILLCFISLMASAHAQNAWKLDHIMITFWCPPPATDEALSAVAAENYTMTWTPEDGLDVAARHGLRAMLQNGLLNPATLDDPAKKADLDALIKRVKKHPALEAYYILDEPSAGAFPALGRLVAYLRERDPAHLAYINLFPTYANNQQLGTEGDTVTAYREHLRQYVEVVKPGLISYDHYHFFKSGDGEQYFLNLSMIRQAALDAGVPFLNIIQADTIHDSWRLPTADEMRFLIYTTLAYGGRGISYFTYWGPAAYNGLYQDGKRMPLALDVAALNGEIRAFSPELMKLDSMGAYHTDPLPLGGEAMPADCPVQIVGSGEFVLGVFGVGAEATAFMVVNRNYSDSQVARVKLPAGARGVQEYDRASRAWRGYAQGSDTITVQLRPGDGRLFRWSK